MSAPESIAVKILLWTALIVVVILVKLIHQLYFSRKKTSHAITRRFPNFESVMNLAPGPSPWYFRANSPEIKLKDDRVYWMDGKDEGFNAFIFMKNKSGELLGALYFCCYVKSLGESRFLIWYEESIPATVPTKGLKIILMDANSMTPIDLQPELPAMRNGSGKSFYFSGGVMGSLTIPTYLGGGQHRISFPESFKCLDELLILATAHPPGRKPGDIMNHAIVKLMPKSDEFEIVRLDWFNHRNADFGYEWPTRVARDPESKKLFLSGIRFADQVLNEDGSRVEL